MENAYYCRESEWSAVVSWDGEYGCEWVHQDLVPPVRLRKTRPSMASFWYNPSDFKWIRLPFVGGIGLGLCRCTLRPMFGLRCGKQRTKDRSRYCRTLLFGFGPFALALSHIPTFSRQMRRFHSALIEAVQAMHEADPGAKP